jgi:hypothetical protein
LQLTQRRLFGNGILFARIVHAAEIGLTGAGNSEVAERG